MKVANREKRKRFLGAREKEEEEEGLGNGGK
jgi:hypothetical protein